LQNLNSPDNISEYVFAISLEDLQYEAKEKLGRELTDDEIEVAKKKLECGLLTGIDSVYGAIFDEMIPDVHRKSRLNHLSKNILLLATIIFLAFYFYACTGYSVNMGIKGYTAVNEDNDSLKYYIGTEDGSAGKSKLLVLVQGSGRESISRRFGWGAEAAMFGYDVLYLEKYAYDDSLKFLKTDCRERRMKDISFAINDVAKNVYGNNLTEICLFADSEGGVLAPELASEIALVKKILILGNGGLSGVEKINILFDKEKKYNYNGYLAKSGIKSKDDLDVLLKEIKDNPDTDKYFLGNTYKYWNSYIYYDIDRYYEKLKIPALVIMGEKDFSVPYESALYLKEKFQKNNLFTVEIIPDADHLFVNSKGEKQFNNILKTIIYPWFKRTSN
jgi:esterase/lipase